MKVKILGMVSLLVVLTLGFAAVAEAAEVEGNGLLLARGAGYAEIQGSGVVNIAAHGVGMVSVKGAEVLRAQGQGRRWDLPDGTTVFAGWRGHIYIEGHGLKIHMLGGVIEFTAQGTGTVFLKGRGHYRVNGEPGRWTLEGVRTPLSAPADSDSQ